MGVREILTVFTFDVVGSENVQNADQLSRRLRATVQGLALALAGTSLVSFAQDVATATTETDKFGRSIGTSAEDVSRWNFILGDVGLTSAETQKSLEKFGGLAKSAARGGENAMTSLGVASRDARGQLRPFNERLTETVQRLGEIGDRSKRARVAQRLFGEGGEKFIEVALGGANAIAAQKEVFDDLFGGGSYAGFTKDSKELTLATQRLKNTFSALSARLARFLIPVIRKITNAITGAIRVFAKFTKGTKIVQTTLVLLGAVAAAVAAKIVIAFSPVIITVLSIVAAFAAIALVVEDLFVLFTGGESLIGRTIDRILGIGEAERLVNQVKTAVEQLTEFFRRLGEVAIPIISKIADAISTLANKISSAIKRLDALATAAAEELGITSAFRALTTGARAAAERGDTEVSSEDVTGAATAAAVRAGRLAPENVPAQFRPDFDAIQAQLARGLTGGFGGAPVTVTNTNTINVTGTGDPEETARVVLEALDEREQDTLRNAREQLGAR